MPLPILLWGAAAGLAATGIIKGKDALDTLDTAKRMGQNAERRHREAKEELEEKRQEVSATFQELGEQKKEIFQDQIKHIVEMIKKNKDAKSTLEGFETTFTIEEVKSLQNMVNLSIELDTNLASSAMGGALAGLGAYGSVGWLATASTGTAISSLSGVAASNATLAWLGGGSLAAGGFGMAGGMIALGGIVAGPALAIGGFMLASKAEEAITQAREYRDQVDTAIEKIDLMKVGLEGLEENAHELSDALNKMVERFEQVKTFDISDKAAMQKMFAVGRGLKDLLDISLMAEDGSAIPGIQQKCAGVLNV